MKITSLKQLKPTSAVLQLKHPISGDLLKGADGKALTVTVEGYSSDAFLKATIANQRRLAEADEALKTDPAFMIEQRAHFLAAAIAGWSHEDVFGPYSKATAFALFNDYEMANYAEQIEQFAAERANFFVK